MFIETYCGGNKVIDWTTTGVSEIIVEPLSVASQLTFCDKSSDEFSSMESYLPIKNRALGYNRGTQSHEVGSITSVLSLKQIHAGLFCFKYFFYYC